MTYEMIDTNGIRLRAVVEGSGPLVVFVHGFPESWYSWRHQIGPVSEAGFTACAIDVRGYGGSDKPHPVEAYDMETLVADVAGVIEALRSRNASPDGKAILVGHDWGAPIVWSTALSRPDRVRAVAGLSVPYTGIPTVSAFDLFTEMFTKRGRFFYAVYFQDEGVAEAEMEADPRAALRKFYYAISGDAPGGAWPLDKAHGDTLLHRLPDPKPFPSWLTKADEDFYVAEFTSSGFRGPLNRYRNHVQDFEFLNRYQGETIHQPAFFIGGSRDLVLKIMPGGDVVELMRRILPNLQGAHVLDGCGHWTQQERAAEVNALLVPWLKSL